MPTGDYEKWVRDTLRNIEASDSIHPRNKTLIVDYKRDKVLDGVKDSTLSKNLTRMKLIGEHVGDRPFDKMGKSEMKDLVEWVHSEYDKPNTIYTVKSVIKAFWKWMNGGDEYPDTVAWIKTNPPSGNSTLPKDLLTKDDISAQIDATKNARDAALISMLYETGARIGELIDLTVGDIEDRKNGRKVVIEGKTGARRIPLVESVPLINRWLSQHPNPTKNAPLWCKIQQGGPDDQLGYRYITEKILKKTMTEAGIEKPSNPHHYRHSRASYLANHMTEAQLCAWFGWVQGSNVPAKYVHLSGRDIDNAYDAMHGLYVPEEDGDEPRVQTCGRCQELNEPSSFYCSRCGFALGDETAADFEAEVATDVKRSYAQTDPDDTETQAKIDALDSLLDDPEVKTALLRRMGVDRST
ncbi:tyrosine-type recombinase/integrase [Haloferax sp. DFSO52]|uniref:tyrosine-type recombinase/integrase n=1 Tax=Haloferax sp. DFSO52 TaxID=3388505 RepID=UPI003A8604D1